MFAGIDCGHPMSAKYAVSGVGQVCTYCDPTWIDVGTAVLGAGGPLLTATLRADAERGRDLWDTFWAPALAELGDGA